MKNLWGEIPVSETLRTPLAVLKEQGELMTTMTDGLLEGRANVERSSDNSLIANLDIVAPALGGYSYRVVRVIYPVGIYPLIVQDMTTSGARYSCSDENGFLGTLESILSSQPVRTVIRGLLAQSREVT